MRSRVPLLLVAAVVGLLSLVQVATALESCPGGWTTIEPSDGQGGTTLKCVQHTATGLSWQAARDHCAGLGTATLARLTDAATANAIAAEVGAVEFWVGLSDVVGSGEEFRWLSVQDGVAVLASGVGYANWASGQSGSGGCVFVDTSGEWRVAACTTTRGAVCELHDPPTTDCASGWTPLTTATGTECLKHTTAASAASWFDARDSCMADGATLAHLDDSTVHKMVATAFGAGSGGGGSWVGLATVDGAEFVWVGTQHLASDSDVVYWGDSEPSSASTQWCGTLSETGSAWLTAACTTTLAFTCQYTPSASSGCGSGWWEFVDDTNTARCFRRHDHGSTLDYATAKSTCWSDYSAHLAASSTQAAHAFVATMFSKATAVAGSWIGLSNYLDDTTLWWMGTGTAVTYTAWMDAQPGAGEVCAAMHGGGQLMGQWEGKACGDTSLQAMVCEKLASPACDAGYVEYSDPAGTTRCFRHEQTSATWFDARSACVSAQGNLAMLDTQAVDFLVASTAPATGDYHIGITDLFSSGNYVWLRNPDLAVTYTAWYNQDGNNCAELQVATGKWQTISCTTTRWRVCEKLAEPTCAAGTVDYLGDCYALTTSGTFDSYVQQCAAAQGALPCIDEGTARFVSSQFASTTSSHWLPVSAAESTNDYQQPVCPSQDYSNWDTNEPSATSDQCTLLLSNRKWADAYCSNSHTGVCIFDPAEVECPTDFIPLGDHCYAKKSDSRWSAYAKMDCRSVGAQLACLNDAEEASRMVGTFGLVHPSWSWIALVKGSSGEVSWPGWCTSDFINYATNEPDGSGDCFRITSGGEFNDADCSSSTTEGYVCEYDPNLQISGMEAEVNLALHKPVVGALRGDTSLVVDDSTSTGSISATAPACGVAGGLTVVVDLGAEALVSSVHAVHAVGASFCGLSTQLSTTGEFGGEEVEVQNTGESYGGTETASGVSVTFSAQRARFVKHTVGQSSSSGDAQLTELQVMGRLFAAEENLAIDFQDIDSIQVSNPLLGTVDFSISFDLFFRDESIGYRPLVHQRNVDCGDYMVLVYLLDRKIHVFTKDPSGNKWSLASGTIAPLTWHSVVAVQDTEFGGGRLYIDGQLVGSDNGGNLELVCKGLYLGSDVGSPDLYTGLMDNFAMWDSVLGASEIADMYSSGTIPQTANLVTRYDFNSPSLYYAKDSSGNGNHGFIEGTPLYYAYPVMVSGTSIVSLDTGILNNAGTLLFQTNLGGGAAGTWTASASTTGLTVTSEGTSTGTLDGTAFGTDVATVLGSAVTSSSAGTDPIAISAGVDGANGVYKVQLVAWEPDSGRTTDVLVEGFQVLRAFSGYTTQVQSVGMGVVMVDTARFVPATTDVLALTVRHAEGSTSPIRMSAFTMEDFGCAHGFYYDDSGSSRCVACGTHETSTGGFVPECECDSGASGSPCQQCAAGTFKRDPGAEACLACPDGTASPAGAVHWSQCACDIDSDFVASSATEVLCPECARSANGASITLSTFSSATVELAKITDTTPFASGSYSGFCTSTAAGTGGTGLSGINCFSNLNDGVYGDNNAWRPSTTAYNSQFFGGVAFDEPRVVSVVAFGRDQTGVKNDVLGTVTVEFSTVLNADHTTTDWTAVGSVTLDTGARHMVQLSEQVCATAVRLSMADANVIIDEIEVYDVVPSPSPTPSPSPSASATSSATPSTSPSPSPSSSTSATSSASPSSSASATASSTASATPSPTPSATATSSATASRTPSSTPSDTPTSSATASDTPSASTTSSITPSATASHSPSATTSNTPSPSASPTVSPTPSASPTGSVTPSASPTVSVTPSASPTASMTSSASPTGSETPSTSPTESATPSPSATGSVTPSASPTVSVTPSASPTLSVTPSTSPTGSVTPSSSATGSETPSVSPTVSATPSGSPTGSVTISVSPTVSTTSSGSPTQSVTGSASPTGSVTISVSPTESATPSTSPTEPVTASTSPTGSATASTSPTGSATASTPPAGSVTTSTSPTVSSTRSVSPTLSLVPASSTSPQVSVTTSSNPRTPSVTPTPSLLHNVFSELDLSGFNFGANTDRVLEALVRLVLEQLQSGGGDFDINDLLVTAAEQVGSGMTSAKQGCDTESSTLRVGLFVEGDGLDMLTAMLEDAQAQTDFSEQLTTQMNCTGVACCPEVTATSYSTPPVRVGLAVNVPDDSTAPTGLTQSLDTDRGVGSVSLEVLFTRASDEGEAKDDLVQGYRLVLTNDSSANAPATTDGVTVVELRLDELGGAPGQRVSNGFVLSNLDVSEYSHFRVRAFNSIGAGTTSTVAAVLDYGAPTTVATDVEQRQDAAWEKHSLTATVNFRRPTNEVSSPRLGTSGYRLYIGTLGAAPELVDSKTLEQLGGAPGEMVESGFRVTAHSVHDDDDLIVVAYNAAFEADDANAAVVSVSDSYLDEAVAAAATAVGAVATAVAVVSAFTLDGAATPLSAGHHHASTAGLVLPVLFVLQQIAAQAKRTIYTLDVVSRGVGAALAFTNFDFGILGDGDTEYDVLGHEASAAKRGLKSDEGYSTDLFVVSGGRAPDTYFHDTLLGFAIVFGIAVVLLACQAWYSASHRNDAAVVDKTQEFVGMCVGVVSFAYFGLVTAALCVLTVDDVSGEDVFLAVAVLLLVAVPLPVLATRLYLRLRTFRKEQRSPEQVLELQTALRRLGCLVLGPKQGCEWYVVLGLFCRLGVAAAIALMYEAGYWQCWVVTVLYQAMLLALVVFRPLAGASLLVEASGVVTQLLLGYVPIVLYHTTEEPSPVAGAVLLGAQFLAVVLATLHSLRQCATGAKQQQQQQAGQQRFSSAGPDMGGASTVPASFLGAARQSSRALLFAGAGARDAGAGQPANARGSGPTPVVVAPAVELQPRCTPAGEGGQVEELEQQVASQSVGVLTPRTRLANQRQEMAGGGERDAPHEADSDV